MRLIDADEFIEYLGLDEENAREENLGEIVTLEDFDRQPTVDAEPVRHGKWIDEYDGSDDMLCSVCGAKFNKLDNCTELFDCCPHCGAKMDLEEGEDNA